jgi:ribosomal protein S18 acetylase RimI-like enzyme
MNPTTRKPIKKAGSQKRPGVVCVAKVGRIEALSGVQVVGYILFGYAKDLSKNRNIEIEYIYVKPTCRGRGIASEMIRFLIRKHPNAVWINLWTGRSIEEHQGTSLYVRNGFKLLAYQKDWYADGIGVSLFGIYQGKKPTTSGREQSNRIPT